MARILQDIWILTETGIVVFNRTYDETVRSQLFGALMSALNTFAEEISKGGLSSFNLSDRRFSIIKQANFIFVASSSAKVKEKKALQELKYITENFFKTYSKDQLDNWDGDLGVFTNFKEKITKSIELKVQKFLDNI